MNMHLRERPSHVRTFEMIETQALRQRMEAAIETMLAALDELDGDPDFECANDNEPWLSCGASGHYGAYGEGDDRELDIADLEPSLAAAECHPHAGGWGVGQRGQRRDASGSQAGWAKAGSDEREADDEREPDADFEPSLGGSDDDRELDGADQELVKEGE